MWNTYPADDPINGLVQFVSELDSSSSWSFDVRGGTNGIRLLCGGFANADVPVKDPECFFSIQPVGPDSLPLLAEQFVRGDELHLFYPQLDGSFALRVMLQPMEVLEDAFVLEAILSIETDLLDSHPMIDIVSKATKVRSLSTGLGSSRRDSGGAAAISLCERDSDAVAVLLGRHDNPFTADRCSDEGLRLRLFGDFLEKGVIRKARPWLVVRRGKSSFDEHELQQCWAELDESPLPLTP